MIPIHARTNAVRTLVVTAALGLSAVASPLATAAGWEPTKPVEIVVAEIGRAHV